MSHPHYRLELLNVPTMKTEGIVFHIMNAKHLLLLIHVILHSHFMMFIALTTTFKSVVKDRTIEPSVIVKFVLLFSVTDINTVGQIVSLVQFCAVDEDILRVVGGMNAALSEVEVSFVGVVGVRDVEFEVAEDILENQDGHFILPEHEQYVVVGACYIVSETSCCVDQQIVVSQVEVEHIIES